MHDLTEFETELIVGARMAGASVTKTSELLGFSRVTISRIMTKFMKHWKPSSTRSNCGRTSKLPTETDVHQNVLWEESIGLLPPEWLLSSINIWIDKFRPKLFAVISIKPDIMEEPPSGNLEFPPNNIEKRLKYIPRRVHFFSFPNCSASLCAEAAQEACNP